MDVGCRENKFDMRWRFFKRFQQRVEGRVGQHVDFVDNINLEFAVRWQISRVGS